MDQESKTEDIFIMEKVISRIILVEPVTEFMKDALQYRDECLAADGIVHGDGGLAKSGTYESWLKHLQQMNNEETVPEGLVASSTYFAVDVNTKKIPG